MEVHKSQAACPSACPLRQFGEYRGALPGPSPPAELADGGGLGKTSMEGRSMSTTARPDRAWVLEAVRRIEADAHRSADTHLLRVPLAGALPVALYLKDESTHPTGNLK